MLREPYVPLATQPRTKVMILDESTAVCMSGRRYVSKILAMMDTESESTKWIRIPLSPAFLCSYSTMFSLTILSLLLSMFTVRQLLAGFHYQLLNIRIWLLSCAMVKSFGITSFHMVLDWATTGISNVLSNSASTCEVNDTIYLQH